MKYQNFWKRLLDIIFSIILLIFTIVPMIVIAIVIKVTTGDSPIFMQTRYGENSIPFKLYKFRSMSEKAPILSNQEFLDLGSYLTTVGKFLRSTSIDELPQLINVLKGDMSFIGPRPLAKTDLQVINLRKQSGADKVKPGITGLAQVNGRNTLSDEDKAKYDAKYAETLSLVVDCKIFMKTIHKVIVRDGVYKKVSKE